jgi:hypothetical protein
MQPKQIPGPKCYGHEAWGFIRRLEMFGAITMQ